MEECPFCKIIKSDIIFETDLSLAFYDKFPVSKGHILIIPKRHVLDYFDLTADEKQDVIKCIDKIKILLDSKYSPNGYNVGFNAGKSAGQSVPHCHIHVIPRYKGDMENPKGGIRGVIPGKQGY